MGRPRKTTITLEENKSMEEKKIRIVVRFLSKKNLTDPSTGEVSGRDFEKILENLYDEGYHIVTTHYLGETVEGYGVLVILQK